MSDEHSQLPDEPAPDDEFENLVLDDSFVRGGPYEPPARTRVAIARYGDQATSWRHGGGLSRSSRDAPGPAPRGRRRRDHETVRETPQGSRLSPSLAAKLPMIVTIVVVAIAAFLIFR